MDYVLRNVRWKKEEAEAGVFKPQLNIEDGDFTKIVNSFQLLKIFGKSSILNIWLSSEFTSERIYLSYFSFIFYI